LALQVIFYLSFKELDAFKPHPHTLKNTTYSALTLR